jgi:hypothetical protein
VAMFRIGFSKTVFLQALDKPPALFGLTECP